MKLIKDQEGRTSLTSPRQLDSPLIEEDKFPFAVVNGGLSLQLAHFCHLTSPFLTLHPDRQEESFQPLCGPVGGIPLCPAREPGTVRTWARPHRQHTLGLSSLGLARPNTHTGTRRVTRGSTGTPHRPRTHTPGPSRDTSPSPPSTNRHTGERGQSPSPGHRPPPPRGSGPCQVGPGAGRPAGQPRSPVPVVNVGGVRPLLDDPARVSLSPLGHRDRRRLRRTDRPWKLLEPPAAAPPPGFRHGPFRRLPPASPPPASLVPPPRGLPLAPALPEPAPPPRPGADGAGHAGTRSAPAGGRRPGGGTARPGPALRWRCPAREGRRGEMSRARADEEEYWHSSKFRAFTFDDEDDELSQLKESKRAVNSLRDIVDDDDDDLERVSWSGEPVGSISWSIKETASSSTSSLEGRDSSLQKGSSSYAAFPKQVSSYSLSSLFKGRNRLPSFQSLSDALSDTGVKNYAPELRRPKAEYKDYSSDWSPKDTVRRMQRGKICSLERFRSLQDKLVLLDEAVAGHDGNVITAVLIFLKRTLRREILFRELEVRQVALCHLIHFLKETGEQKLLLDLLRFLDRTEEVALSQYREHLNIQDVEKRREFLKGCIGLPFSAEDTSHIQDHYTLLERQIIIEANDRHLEMAGQSEIFRKYPRKASILNMPLVTTLFYSCFYHYTEAEGTFSSPTNLKKTFKIPDKQYVLTALAARAKLRAWDDVDALFTTKNWLGYTKKKAPIGFHRVVEILQRNNAPVQVLQEYVRLVEDVETRLNLATKYKCHDVVIETYRDLKDRIQLTAYKCKVERGSAEEEKINSVLNNTQIRWKN